MNRWYGVEDSLGVATTANYVPDPSQITSASCECKL
eukprot:COSAG05_NODE_17041_length_333_cov_0.662393_1_plen_35_part_10